MEILAVDKSSYLQAWAVSDLDADGHSDIALGVVTRSESFIDLMSGKTCKRLLRIKTPLSRCNAASAVACLGDLDGDSVPDLGVGSGRCAAAASRYRVSIFSGKTGAVLGQLVDGEPAAGFGSAIGAVTDLDGDGVTDIVLVDDANGRSSVYSGRERRFVRHLEGSWNEARGASEMGGVSLLRDLNGDGVRDFAVAVDALLEARVRVYSGKDGSLIRSHSEPGVPGFSGRFAACVADVGDLDHDGKGDYAVGASHGICGFAHGFVAAYSGGSGGILFIVNARQLSAR